MGFKFSRWPSPEPALIIMDVDMPVLNGLQALDKLRETPDARDPGHFSTGLFPERLFRFFRISASVPHQKAAQPGRFGVDGPNLHSDNL